LIFLDKVKSKYRWQETEYCYWQTQSGSQILVIVR